MTTPALLKHRHQRPKQPSVPSGRKRSPLDHTTADTEDELLSRATIIAQIFVCDVTRSTTAEVQHNDMMMWTNVQNDLRHEMALEMWIVSVHEKSEQL